MSTQPDIDWTGEIVASLRQLWAEGRPTAEIGRRLGVTKNAIIGKARRLGLERRPSPIRKNGARTPRLPPAPRLADIMPTTTAVTAPGTPAARSATSAAYQPKPVGLRASVLRPSSQATSAPVTSKPCCWPIGDPGTRGFRFCGGPALTGKPYCAEHCAIAYGRPRHACGERAKNPR